MHLGFVTVSKSHHNPATPMQPQPRESHKSTPSHLLHPQLLMGAMYITPTCFQVSVYLLLVALAIAVLGPRQLNHAVCYITCGVDDAGQSSAGYDIKPQAAMEMLSTCDGRLQALMAEANLLGEAALSQGQVPSEDVDLRQAFASTLIESGTAMLPLSLSQQRNATVCNVSRCIFGPVCYALTLNDVCVIVWCNC